MIAPPTLAFWKRFPRWNSGNDSSEASLALIHAQLKKLADESDTRLRELAEELKEEVRKKPAENSPAKAIALAAEGIRRTHRLTAYDVQFLAGLALADGRLAEMATGEGKTLAALLAAFYFGLHGRGTHVATVNPYLAERDAEFATPVLSLLGLHAAYLDGNAKPAQKRAAYVCDVTYGVGTDFGFDYLRDQLAIRAAGRTEPHFHEILLGTEPRKPVLLQRGHAFAIIDEADSVLIDEARSPLIISAGAKRPSASPEVYRLADQIAGSMERDVDFIGGKNGAAFILTPAGITRAFELLNDAVLSQIRRTWQHYIEHALHVRHHFRRDVHYVVSEDKVMIVDEFTGRLCPDRTWREGLHQAAEAHAGVTITEENNSEATISRPAYFQLYERICGLTGTAAEASSELKQSYKLPTTVIPLHRTSRRELLPDRVFKTRAAKLAAIVEEVSRRHATGQPILLGTRTIENSEALEEALKPLKLTLRVLNARQDAEEAAIIENAGQPGAITIATNMAGRGAHIPVPEKSRDAGGLHVIGLERHESARIDRQLIGRAARQGQPGSAQFFLSLEDDLVIRHAPSAVKELTALTTSADELAPETAKYFLRAQRKAEQLDRSRRRMLAAQHQWLDELKQAL